LEKNNYSDNKYLLTMMVAKRAKQLNQGYKPLVEVNTRNNRLLALKEIKKGMVYIKGDKNHSTEKLQETEEFPTYEQSGTSEENNN